MILYLLLLNLLVFYTAAYGALAGGRPNAFSEGQNAFAGVVNPANAVWIADRLDLGAFWVHQKSSLNNHDNNPLFVKGKMDLTYRTRNLFTADAAIHRQVKLKICSKSFDSSWSLAAYSMPSFVKLRTEEPIPIAGTTPVVIINKIDVVSLVFSLKLNPSHSIGYAIDYLYFSHRRNGFQNSDNNLRSVSPGNVTNNGTDHSKGIGFGIGWRWNITRRLDFGVAWSKKSYCGQYRKYRGFEPHHAENYTPQTIGAGFSYRFTSKFAGRLEVLWANLGNLPGANNNVLSDGSLNLNKRGSKKSPGPGLSDATYINIGIGYQVNRMLSVGASFSHRWKIDQKTSNILSHTYRLQTIYDVLSLGANFNYQKHNLFLGISYGFRNKVSGFMPIEVEGGRFTGEKQDTSVSMSWGYLY
jgi:long-chain fatty acid transport protein